MKLTFNHCSLAPKDTELEQLKLFAYGLNYKLKKGLITREKAIAELNTREDRKQVIEILKELKVNQS